MKVFNLSENKVYEEFKNYSIESFYLIMATQYEFDNINEELDLHMEPLMDYGNLDQNIRFESYPKYDFISFVYFEFIDDAFEFEVFNIYYSSNFIVLVLSDEKIFDHALMQQFNLESYRYHVDNDSLNLIFHQFLNSAFINMFDAMRDYESTLSKIENEILMDEKGFDFERIVELKNDSFEIKRCLRFLSYVGDEILANDNDIISNEEMRYFKSVDMRINRMYEYSVNLHEASEHLMALYNSTVNSKTNDTINKLTIVTVFATPLTVLTGLYGMNFINMPELSHRYGYFILLGIMLLIIVVMYAILKKIKLL